MGQKKKRNRKQGISTRRNYKDSLFCMIFKEKKELLSLYNALNGTAYTDANDLTVNTLENAIYMNMKNDISCLIDNHMDLYEQQSTYCPNMPMRELMYVSRLYEKELKEKNLYSTTLVRIPTPRFIVLYNGTKKMPEQCVLKLSDAFMAEEEPNLELRVTMLNINAGMNAGLLDKCRTLKDYAAYVEKVREYGKNMPTDEAVELAVKECIKSGILAEFLTTYRAEAVQLSIFEYDQEWHMRCIEEEALKTGHEEGFKEGHEKGREEERQNTELERKRAERAEWELAELKKELALLKEKVSISR